MTTRRRGRPRHDDVLTDTEWQIAHAVKHGLTNREIANRRAISPDGVKFHVANVLAKLQLRDRRALRQWFRAPKNSPLNKRQKDMVALGKTFALRSIGQIARTVTDIAESERWYREVLGLPHLFTFGKLAFFDCGGTRLLLTQEGPVSAVESILYFRVEDIQRAHELLKARAIEFISAPHMIHRHADGTEEWMAFIRDPEGRPLALMSQVKA
jgi:DNA-binding CsgD family transcriptional regulator/catechol 2,3-dioxygenase-like lactoylglutathione lyase family enzyme